jgi:drug/metabolite transporter (DMT)-like permease
LPDSGADPGSALNEAVEKGQMRPSDVTRLVLLGGIWGASFLFIKVALDDLTPLQIVAARIAVGALLLVGLLYARGGRIPRDRELLGTLTIMAFISNIVPFGLITWGEQYITSSLTAILNSTTPLFTVLIAAAFLPGEALRSVRLAGVVLGFAGVGVIVGFDSGGSLQGIIAVTIASLSYAAGFVYARRHLSGRDLSPLALPATQLLISTLLTLPFALVDVARTPPSLTLDATASTLALGLLGTGWAYVLYYRLIADIGATSASFVTYLIPIFGIGLGAVVLNEDLGVNTLAGAALVIGGIALAELGNRRPTPSEGAACEVQEAATRSSETTVR